jgi:hypothetical protein
MVAAGQALTMMTGWSLPDDLVDYAARALRVRALLNQSMTSGDLDGLLMMYEVAHAQASRRGLWISPEYATVLEECFPIREAIGVHMPQQANERGPHDWGSRI